MAHTQSGLKYGASWEEKGKKKRRAKKEPQRETLHVSPSMYRKQNENYEVWHYSQGPTIPGMQTECQALRAGEEKLAKSSSRESVSIFLTPLAPRRIKSIWAFQSGRLRAEPHKKEPWSRSRLATPLTLGKWEKICHATLSAKKKHHKVRQQRL